MTEKVGRNDPCPCGSGKKYKQCCMAKQSMSLKDRLKKTTWINKPQQAQVDLMERTFGQMSSHLAGNKPPVVQEEVEQKDENGEKQPEG